LDIFFFNFENLKSNQDVSLMQKEYLIV